MVIPIHDKNPVRRTAYVTYALIAVNFVVFLIGPAASLTGGGTPQQACAQQRYFLEHGAIPFELLHNHQLTTAQEPRMLVDTSLGQALCVFGQLPHKVPALSVLTAMFIHAGWLHLLGNMLFLYVFGNNVEDRLGRFHFLLFYLGGGYIATYAFAFLNPSATTPLVGASGAIAAALGGYLYLYPKAKVTSLVPFLFFLPLRFPAWAVLGSWFVLQLPAIQHLLGVPTDSTVAYIAHIAGFTAGFLYVMVFAGRGRAGPPPPTRRSRAASAPASGPPDPYGTDNPYPPRYPTPPR
ncbi:MAG TPA: rhomboid family intramembrane serine protease [Actinocrinis sp.]|uniref:rhomboid family intramembrane serine protease n=1 Tax=Actinocrinis sp. TaxID=1920516 RepID=UPI002DDDA088|nr:rhomboid family intramembrane serine protease [Actinocrinis sp.]HEV2346037.1 rhomboid family intramembrane serine protease [Actinocrinis sp.]